MSPEEQIAYLHQILGKKEFELAVLKDAYLRLQDEIHKLKKEEKEWPGQPQK